MEEEQFPVIDWEQGLKMAGNKPELAQEILALFIKDLPTHIAIIKQLYNDKNFPELKKELHKLHGALCYCGLPRLKTLIAQLETNLKSNIMDSLPSLFDQLQNESNLLLDHYSKQH